MAKKIELVDNSAGGVDLITERDAGNEIRILTGRKTNSLAFWQQLRQAAAEAIERMQAN